MKTTLITVSLGLLTLLAFTACRSTPSSTGPTTLELFNGRDLTGWHAVLADTNTPWTQVWSVRDGHIVCLGTPLGYLHTPNVYTNFRLAVEYRWAPDTKPGNSGLFSRVNGPARALPRCAEVQLFHGSAGDVLTLQGMTMATNQARYFAIKNHEIAGDVGGVKKLKDMEKAPGLWNLVEVLAEGPRYTVWVNGEKVNEAEGLEVLAGPIGLQSEGGEIHFRRVSLTPLP